MSAATMRRLSFGAAEFDKFRAEAAAALCVAGTPGFAGTWENPATGLTEPFRQPQSVRPSALAVAKQCMMTGGVDAQAVMDAPEVVMAQAMLGQQSAWQQIDPGMDMAGISNVTGMYVNLLIDAGNVQLRKAYTEVETTFQIWAVRGEDFANYDKAHSVSVGAFPDPTVIGEDGEFDEVSTVDGRETLHIHEWGMKTSWSFKLIASDRLAQVIGSMASKMGGALRRKQNRLVYGVLKANAALADNVALFHSSHGNLTTGSVSDYSAAMNTVNQKLGAQTAPGSGSAPLGIRPAFVLHPPALQQSFFELLESPVKPTGTTPGIPNMYRGTARPVMEWDLAAQFGGSDTAWYVVGDPKHCEGVVYACLAGQDGPQFDVFTFPGTLGYRAKIHQAFAAGAVDFRPLQLHTGV